MLPASGSKPCTRAIIPEAESFFAVWPTNDPHLVTLATWQAAVTQWIEYLPPKKGVARSIRAGGAILD